MLCRLLIPSCKSDAVNVDGIYDIDEKKVKKSLEEAITAITKYCGGDVIDAGVIKANGELIPLDSYKNKEDSSAVNYAYRERKIITIINGELNRGQASNALGHIAVSAGRYLDNSWMGDPLIKDADGTVHKGISKHPFIILTAPTKKIKEIVIEAKKMGIFCVDYPQEMFDTGTDEDLTKALSKMKAKDIVYHAVLLAGKTDKLASLTRGLQLYE